MAHVPTQGLQVHDLPRINEISLVLARNGFGYLLRLIGQNPTDDEAPGERQASFARRLRQVLVELGPTFVKLGQVLSVRPDILPQDIMVEFETLQDRVPAMAPEDVTWVLERELGRPVDEVFTYVDPNPLGSASIAQVHKAQLKTGEVVAVKLQRRGIDRVIRSDISILYTLATLAEGQIELPGVHTPRAIIREFDIAISKELDFLQEMQSASRLAAHLQSTDLKVRVPRMFEEWSTQRMLIMELCEGSTLREAFGTIAPAGPEAKRLAHVIMESTYLQAFEFGFFHGDPHPGNLIVQSDGTLVYLDFGVTGMLTGAMQDIVITAFTSLAFRDAETLAMTVYRAGATHGRVDLKAFSDEIARKMHEYHGASLDDLASPATLMELVEMCTRFGISLPPEFAVLSRAVTLVEASLRKLLPGTDIVTEVKPYAQRLVTRRFSPEQVAQDAARALVQMQNQLRDVPLQLNQALMDLEGGNITIITKDPDAILLREEIRNAVLRLSLAAAASTMTLGSMVFLATHSPEIFGIPVVWGAGFGVLLVGLLLFGALGLHVFFFRFLSVKYWRRVFFSILGFFVSRRRE
ncbi:MAG: AarF/UbiB family protein [Myxococcota bacterium]